MTLLERVMEWLAPAPKCTCKTKPMNKGGRAK